MHSIIFTCNTREFQTANAFLFAIMPIMVACVAMQWRLELSAAGTAFLAPLSWLPAANALLTIRLIKVYRHWVHGRLGRCFGRCIPKVGKGGLATAAVGSSSVVMVSKLPT